MASAAGAVPTSGSGYQPATAAPADASSSGTDTASAAAASGSQPSSSQPSSSSSSSSVSALPAELGDQWEHNKPVEMRCAALNEEMSDCLGCFWRWVTCGGPGARVRQLYVNGRLSRCMDEYTKFRNCLALKLDPEAELKVLPGPHALWHIRTRRQAHEFWSSQYEHLGARRQEVFGSEEAAGREGEENQPRRRRRREDED